MFVSVGNADEIRMVRRTNCEDSELKQCDLHSLNLAIVAQRLEGAWSKPAGEFSAETLAPRLHILGVELAEGFFANGVVLVEGRSDKAALGAAARLFGVNFEASGIAVLSAEGKENIDRPLVIFRELGIPTYTLWDCDTHKPGTAAKAATNLALLRLCADDNSISEAPTTTMIGGNFAHFSETLERTMRHEIGATLDECLATACAPFGITPSNDAQKIPEIMRQTLVTAKAAGNKSDTLEGVIRAIWQHILGKDIEASGANPEVTPV
jgi:putative ATP-dependent endonuclease of the OLD family